MGAANSKLRAEVLDLKQKLHEAQKDEAVAIREAVKLREQELQADKERAIQEEAAKAAVIEQHAKVLQLRNDILTEMVAAEQVNVRLQQRRSEALKWELLRQGGAADQLVAVTKAAPALAATLSASPPPPPKDMSAVVESMTDIVASKQRTELDQAFAGRDKAGTGRLSGVEFKDALKEGASALSREDRQLLTLRFLRDEDETVSPHDCTFCEAYIMHLCALASTVIV
jgi:hypothetical protein